jgi:hypothetical protein
MASRGRTQGQIIASTHNAVFVTQHLDGIHDIIQHHRGFHLLHHESLAGALST